MDRRNQLTHFPMLVAADFLDSERGRVVQLLSGLERQPEAVKARLVRGFLQIASSKGERLGRRSQALAILGFSCRPLGIKGSISVSRALDRILKSEFLAEHYLGSNATNRPLKEQIDLHGMRLLFLKQLVVSALLIHKPNVFETVDAISRMTQGTELGKWLVKELKRMPSPGFRR